MDGKLTVEVCDSTLTCCNAGELETDRNDFNKGYIDVFYGGQIRDCSEFTLADGNALMIVTHQGLDAWKGEWIRLKLTIEDQK